MSALRPSNLPKLALCPCYESNPVAGPAAERGTLLDTAFRAELLGLEERFVIANKLTAEEIAAVSWSVLMVRAMSGRERVLAREDDCRVAISRRSAPMPYYFRNVNGDEVHFVHQGTGRFETEMGTVPYEPGDYVVIPKAITYRIVPDGAENLFFVVETSDELQVPDYGPLGRHAPFDPGLVFVPEARVIDDPNPWEIVIQHGDSLSSIRYPHDPCDVEGWKGDLFPFKLNIRDWNVISSDTLHLPPSVHQFLGARGVVVCTFLPHPAPSRVGAERVPWYHRNADFDEITFYHGGSFLGTPLPPGLFEHAPQGIHHGAPEIARVMARKTHEKHSRLEWKIVCIETTKPLVPTEAFKKLAGG